MSLTLPPEWERLGAWQEVSGRLLGCTLKPLERYLLGVGRYSDGWTHIRLRDN